MVQTYLFGYRDEIQVVSLTEEGTTDLDRLEELLKDGECHALAVQQPNFFGFLEPLRKFPIWQRNMKFPLWWWQTL